MSVITQVRLGRGGAPTPPVEIADEVEQYARESGRHATLRYVPTLLKGRKAVLGTWRVEFSLKEDDKRLELFRTGRVSEAPAEIVWLHEPDPSFPSGYRPYKLEDLGPSGVRNFLEKGNLHSGRGEHRSLEEMVRRVEEQNQVARTKYRQDKKEENRFRRREERRWRLKIPFIGVAIELGRKNGRNGPAQRGTPQPASKTEM